jgi:hypothetical protein
MQTCIHPCIHAEAPQNLLMSSEILKIEDIIGPLCTTTTPERAGKFTCIHADLYTHLYTRRGPSESSDSEILSDSEGPLRVYKRVYSEEVGLSVYTSLRVYKCVYSEDPLVLNGTRALSKSSDQQDKQNCSVDKFCLWFRVGLLRTSC